MGFTVETKSRIDSQSGIEVAGLYYSFNRSCTIQGIQHEEKTQTWMIQGKAHRYESLADKENGKKPLGDSIIVRIQVSDLSVNVFDGLYVELKTKLNLPDDAEITDHKSNVVEE